MKKKFLVFFVMLALFLSQRIHAQSGYGNIPVNYSKGRVELTIPIFSFEVDGVNIPVYLEYDATGVHCDRIPSAIGLNWKIFFGGDINREIKDTLDEFGYLTGSLMDDPDQFYYSSLFGSGKFSYLGDYPVKESYNNLIIEEDHPNNGGTLSYFIVKDDVGNQYYFGDYYTPGNYNYRNTATINTFREDTLDNTLSSNGVITWLINKITTKNNQEINFLYESYVPEEYSITNYDLINIQTNQYDSLVTTYTSNVNLIKSISADKYYIEFNYLTDSSLEVWEKKLRSIIVKPSQYSSEAIKKIIFNYEKFGDGRLKLKSVTDIGDNETEAGTYTFSYYNEQNIIYIGTQNKDYFGFYNGANNENKTPDNFYRNVTSYLKTWSLDTITYPTGTKTKLYYEPNEGLVGYTSVAYMYDLVINPEVPSGQSYFSATDDVNEVDTVLVSEIILTNNEKIKFPGQRIQKIQPEYTNPTYFIYSDDIEYESGPMSYKSVETQLRDINDNSFLSSIKRDYIIDKIGSPYLEDTYLFDIDTNLVRKIHYEYDSIYYELDTIIQGRPIYVEASKFSYILAKTVTTEYFWDDFNINNPVVDSLKSIKEIAYNDLWLPQKIKEYSLEDNSQELIIKYVADYDSLLNNFGILQDKNMISLPVDKRVLKKSKVVNGEILKYDNFGNITETYSLKNHSLQEYNWSGNLLLPSSYYELESSMAYDSSGQIIDIQFVNGDEQCMVWDNRGNLLAKTYYANSDQVFYTSFEDETGTIGESKTGLKYKTGDYPITFVLPSGSNYNDFAVTYWYYDENAWKYDELLLSSGLVLNNGSRIDEVRIYPVNAMMESYNYDIRDRIISQTDVNNITTYYDYDEYGGIKNVRDKDKNIRVNYDKTLFNEQANLSISVNSLTYERTEETKNVQVDSDKDFYVSSPNGWISFTPSYGFGINQIEVICASNESEESRSGEIIITSENTSQTVSISQDGPELAISGSVPIDFGSSVESKGLSVTANFDDWIVDNNLDWVDVTRNGSNITVECDENYTNQEKLGFFNIGGRGISEKIFVSQDAAIIESISQTSFSPVVEGETTTVNVTANFTDWGVSSSASWIIVSKINGQVVIECQGNQTTTERTGVVTISGRGNSEEVAVSQAGSSLTYNGVLLKTFSVMGGTYTSTVTSNFTDWEISSNVTWLDVSKSGSSVSFSTNTTNNTTAAMQGEVTIYGRGNSTVIAVQMSGSSLTVASTSVSATPYSKTGSVGVTANFTDWLVSDNASWITVTKDATNSEVDYSISANASSSSRSGTITVSGRGNTKTISVSQSGVSLSTDKSSLTYAYVPAGSQTVNITSNYSWTITDNQSWITTGKTSGSGSSSFTVSCGQNTTSSQRTGSVTITCGNISNVINITQDPSIIESISQTSYAPAVEGGTVAVNVVASFDDWVVSSNATWISASKVNGQAVITCQGNPTTTGRTGVVTISGGGNSKQVSVSQAGSSLTYNGVLLKTFGVMGGTYTSTVTSNFADWEISSNVTWLDVSKSGTSVSFSTNTTNNTTATMQGEVTIYGRGNSIAIIVRMSGSSLTVASTSVSATPYSKTGSVDVTANFTDWLVSDNASWITVTKDATNSEVDYSISANTSSSSRSGTITVSGRGNSKAISVSQAGVSLSVNKSSLTYKYLPDGSQSVSITSNYSWTISDNQSWITTSRTSGSGNSSFTISCSPSTSSSSRSGTVTVTSGAVSKTITITQEAPRLDFYYLSVKNKSSVTIDAYSDYENAIVQSNLAWNVTDNASWITISNGSGSYDGTIGIQYASNSGSTSRSGTITFSGGGITRTMTVTQEAPELSVTPTGLLFTEYGGSQTVNITSNYSWTVSTNQSWLHTNITSGVGNAGLTITADQNTLPLGLRGTVVVTCGGITKTISVMVAKASDVPFEK